MKSDQELLLSTDFIMNIHTKVKYLPSSLPGDQECERTFSTAAPKVKLGNEKSHYR